MKRLIIFFVAALLPAGLLAQPSAKPTTEQQRLIRHWLAHTSEARIHQLRGAVGNKMMLFGDGHREGVYDVKGKLVRDGINDGSYNYAHPSKDPLHHFSWDILPWIMWGNSRTDPTSVKERLDAYSLALGDGLSAAQKAAKKAAGKDAAPLPKLTAAETKTVNFFVEVITEGKVEEVYQILTEPAYQSKEPFAIGKGLTEGLVKVVQKGTYKPGKPDKDAIPASP